MAEYCELVSREGDHKNVQLKDGETTILGRGECTGIKDTGCSRKQVEVCLNLSNKELVVKCIGNIPSVAGITTVSKGEQTVIGPGAELQLLPGQHKYSVFFGKRLLNSNHECEMSVKRQLEEEERHEGAQKTKQYKVQPTLKRFFFSSSNPSATVHTCSWTAIHSSLLKMTYGYHTPSSLVASFDLDGTIVSTKSGLLPFRTGPEDWKFWDRCVPKKLHAIHSAGYRIVIFTNQGGMNYGNPPRDEFELKLQAIMESLGDLPVTLFAAIGEDHFRKPGAGMWEHFTTAENKGLAIDMSQSYYIGDAAGRVSNWNKKGCKKDFSCSDRKFAANANLPFHTPEEFFMGEPPCPKFSWDGFNPFSLNYDLDTPSLDPPGSMISSPSQEVVVFVGFPASGKTTFYKTHMANKYLHINRDTLGTWQRCVTETERALSEGRSVVINNTNPDPESRGRYIQAARKVCGDNVQIRCFLFTTSLEHSIHNNKFRERVTEDPSYKKVGWSAFGHYKSCYREPKMEEGFTEIVSVTVNMEFSSPTVEQLYKQFYE